MDDNLNVMYSVGRLPKLPELALQLESALGWKPVYWITQPEIEDAQNMNLDALVGLFVKSEVRMANGT
jgi:hypothetical protein